MIQNLEWLQKCSATHLAYLHQTYFLSKWVNTWMICWAGHWCNSPEVSPDLTCAKSVDRNHSWCQRYTPESFPKLINAKAHVENLKTLCFCPTCCICEKSLPKTLVRRRPFSSVPLLSFLQSSLDFQKASPPRRIKTPANVKVDKSIHVL